MRNLKNILIIAVALLVISCTKYDGYNIEGKVPEAWEGKLVFLTLNDINTPKDIDSTTIKDGNFKFKGKFEIPRYCNIKIYLDANDRITRSKIVNFSLFVDNNKIEITCDNSGVQPVFTTNGSLTDNEYKGLLNTLKPLEDARSKIFSEYTNDYYYKSDIEKAIKLTNEINEKATKIRDAKIDFLKNNPESAISIKIANDLIDRNSDLTSKEIEELFASLSPALQNSEMGQSLRDNIDKRKVFVGEPFIDLELATVDGGKKKISDFVIPGHITLIEFWASWCAPCRSEIPFMRKTYSKYHNKGFNIVGVSVDSNRDHWLNALDDEKLPWIQLLDEESVAYKKYNLKGIPSSFLVNEEGIVISVNARGGWLDAAMQEIYE